MGGLSPRVAAARENGRQHSPAPVRSFREMIRTAFFALAVLATSTLAQTTKTPSSTKPKTGAQAKTAPATKKTSPPPRQKTTLSGVYTLDEATAGKELYAGLCSTCHLKSNLHSGPDFRKKWAGKPISELFTYMRTYMPKNDPGSLADEDYGIILAYMLQLNRMPAGKAYLSTDTLELRKIKFDTVRAVHKP
jgi:S-disulfanyl-L-cysteine oxidoreductase SoxD